MLTAIIVSAIVVPLAIAQLPSTGVNVGNVPPYVCCKWEKPDSPILPAACPADTTVAIYACVCDGNNNTDIASVTATVRSPVVTLSDDELGTQFAYEYGPGSVTITDIAGPGVQFDFTNLNNVTGTLVGDDFPVSQKAGGAWKVYPEYGTWGTWGDFTNYAKYSLSFKNNGTTNASVNIKMNTGWTDPPGGNASDDTFWENNWTSLAAGETKIVTLDFSNAKAWNIADDPVYKGHGNGNYTSIFRLDEVSDIGINVLSENPGASASIIVSATGFTVQTVPLSLNSSMVCPDPPCNCTPYPGIDCTGYSGTVDLDCGDPAGTWCVTVRATDNGSLFNETKNTFELMSLKALNIDFSAVNFGNVDPGNYSEVLGDWNMSTTAIPTVKNIGNDPIDVSMSASDLTGAGTIDGSNVYGDVLNVGPSYKSLKPPYIFDTDTGLPCGNTGYINFKLTVPLGTAPGSYNGTLTITAV